MTTSDRLGWVALVLMAVLLLVGGALFLRDTGYKDGYRDGRRVGAREAETASRLRERLDRKEAEARLRTANDRCADLRAEWGQLLERASSRYRDQLDHVNNELLECQDRCWHQGGGR